MAESLQLLRHTEAHDAIVIDASGCPSAAAQELSQFAPWHVLSKVGLRAAVDTDESGRNNFKSSQPD